MKKLSRKQASAFIRRHFHDGIYAGDNPYLSEVTPRGMVLRWYQADVLTYDDYVVLTCKFYRQ